MLKIALAAVALVALASPSLADGFRPYPICCVDVKTKLRKSPYITAPTEAVTVQPKPAPKLPPVCLSCSQVSLAPQ